VIQDLRKVLKLSRLHSLSLEGRLQQSLEEHRVIMAAFEAGDADKAEKRCMTTCSIGREALAKMDDSATKKPAEQFFGQH
jgi:DNA-binding GntR family transcriptional regulator